MKVHISDYDKDGNRIADVEIEKHDLYNMDTTLAQIIHPMLVKFRENVNCYPEVDDEDMVYAPENLRHAVKTDDSDNGCARWCYILDEMIFAFDNVKHKWEREEEILKMSLNAIEECLNHLSRVQRGTILFGKYYNHLWK